MASQTEVASLEDLCLPVVYSLISNIIVNHDENEFVDEAQFIDDVKMIVRHVPPTLHDKIAEMHIIEIKEIFEGGEDLNDKWGNNPVCTCNAPLKYDRNRSFGTFESYNSFSTCECVNEFEVWLDALLKVMCLLKIKKIKLDEPYMPIYLSNKVLGLLDKMPYIESFTFYSTPWYESHRLLRSKLLGAAASWSNLTIFICQENCTDEILTMICKHCELLQEVDVRHSRVEKPIEPLAICKNLVKVNLENNGLYIKEYLKLLSESKSNNLVQVDGLDDVLRPFLRKLEKKKSSQTFKLQYLKVWETRFKSDEKYFNLIKKYFPSLKKIIFRRRYPDSEIIVDFTSLLNEVSCFSPKKLKLKN